MLERNQLMQLTNNLNIDSAIDLSTKYGVALHPKFIFYWNELSVIEFFEFLNFILNNLNKSLQNIDDNYELSLPVSYEKKYFENIGCEHKIFKKNNVIIIDSKNTRQLFINIGVFELSEINIIEQIEKLLQSEKKSILDIINDNNKLVIRDKGGSYVGSRMGRPEKAKHRRQFLEETSTHGLFVSEDKKERSLNEKISTEKKSSLKHIFKSDYIFPEAVKGVKSLESKDKKNEHLAKGILRAKYGLYVNKDGTCRFDATEMGITHFKPIEIETTVEKLIELGYTHDYLGKKLKKDNQIIEILPQDVILPDCPNSPDAVCSKFIMDSGNFMDELLLRLYKEEPIYNFKNRDDTIGELIVSLAPHTSAGIVGRIIGYSKTQGLFSHPMFHAAQRRNLDGDECGIILLGDCLLNFSREFLPDRRGARTMDVPLVLTTNIKLDEVDDEVFGLDICSKYPLELYEKSKLYVKPNEVDIMQLKSKLEVSNLDEKYSKHLFTHNVDNFNESINVSSYKTLPTMDDKLSAQLDLGDKIRAVDASRSAELIIQKHYLKDIKGNLRQFSKQSFRCTKCNYILRRPTLNGRCPKCFSQTINLTVYEGSIKKYLNPCFKIIERYKISPYTIETIELLKSRLDEIFGEK